MAICKYALTNVCCPILVTNLYSLFVLGHTWVGLVYCNGTSNEWTACGDSGSTVSVPTPCWCPSTSRTVAFTDASKLADIMSLPASLGGSVTWQSGHGPSSQSSQPTTGSTATSSGSRPATTPSDPPAPTTDGVITASTSPGL